MEKSTFSWITKHETETKSFARSIAQTLEVGDVLALEGDLGAGKTVFAKGLAEGLGIQVSIDSPTFTIVKEYQGRIPFYHLDVYRLESADEALGFEEYLYGDGVCLIEWASRISDWLPGDSIDIRLTVLEDDRRQIDIATSLPRVIEWCKGGWKI